MSPFQEPTDIFRAESETYNKAIYGDPSARIVPPPNNSPTNLSFSPRPLETKDSQETRKAAKKRKKMKKEAKKTTKKRKKKGR